MSVDKIISDQLIRQFSKFISGNLGLYFPAKRSDDLLKRFYPLSKKYGFSDPEACIRWLLSSPPDRAQIETLASCLTIGETHFFRDKLIYDSLEEHVLPEIINSRRKTGRYLRIWCAGCSSGEEPYSVAILMHKILPDIKNWKILIIATDIDQTALQKARQGNYSKWSFRSTPQWVKDEYFIKNGEDDFTVKPFVRDMVSFSYHNLAKDPFPSLINNTTAIDIIFCRNVIMYFHPDLALKIINRFHRSLREGGWLIVSGSESYMVNRSRFLTVSFPDTIFFRRYKSNSSETPEIIEDETTVQPQNVLFQENPMDEPTDIPFVPGTVADDLPDGSGLSISPEKDRVREASELFTRGRYRDAEQLLKGYTGMDGEDREAIFLLIKIYSNLGQFGEAIDLCKKGIDSDKCNPAFYFLLALIYREQGKTDDAIACLSRSIYLEDDHVLSHYTLGNILLKKGDGKNAGKYFNNALSLLNRLEDETILPGSDGLSAGGLTDIIKIKYPAGN